MIPRPARCLHSSKIPALTSGSHLYGVEMHIGGNPVRIQVPFKYEHSGPAAHFVICSVVDLKRKPALAPPATVPSHLMIVSLRLSLVVTVSTRRFGTPNCVLQRLAANTAR